MGLFGKLGGKGRGSTQNKFMKILDMADLNGDIVTDTNVPVANTWYRMGTGFTVPAQQAIHFGYGSAELPDNQGYLYINVISTDTTPATLLGKVRLVQANAQETVKYVVAEYNLAATHGSLTNKAMMIALPEQTQFPLVGEDSILSMEVAPSATAATDDVEAATTIIHIPVTIYM